ncbi:MAG: hypothetical protein HOK41_18635 [Nitrospina sp.]|jgi:hypothetical protein|nr:hypothetical protein [Nitrospina sp.]MBT6717953.1 hypothetical protein [Nitrospina sp.]
MKLISKILILSLLLLPACSGVGSVTKKRYANSENTLVLVDMTSRNFDLQDAGSQLQGALEDAMADTSYALSGESARYRLKFKILDFDSGNRIARIATMGFAESARATLRVKVALFDGRDMVGAWEVKSWVGGGPTGGTEEKLFQRAAKEITSHLRGDF